MMHLLLALCLIVTLTPRHVDRSVDGDTFDLFHVGVPTRERVRVLGVDAAERPVRPKTWISREDSVAKWIAYSDSLRRFQAATDSTTAWLARGDFTMATCRRDSFGRLLAWISRGADSLHLPLINAGLGVRP